jgi:hypothetical protein
VLNKGSAHTGGLFGPKGHVPIALVNEVVHLFSDDVGGFADSVEHPDVFKQRRNDLPVSSGRHGFCEGSHELPPTGRFGRKDVAHPWAGLELGHEYSG